LEVKNFKSKLKQNPVSWIVFLSTIIVALFSLISVLFPALILRTLGGFDDNVGIDPFEPGSLAYSFLIINFIFLALGFLYYKNKLPQIITKSIILKDGKKLEVIKWEESSSYRGGELKTVFGIIAISSYFNGFISEPGDVTTESWKVIRPLN